MPPPNWNTSAALITTTSRATGSRGQIRRRLLRTTAASGRFLWCGAGRGGQELRPAGLAAEIECLPIALGVESGGFVHVHAADGVGRGVRCLHGGSSFAVDVAAVDVSIPVNARTGPKPFPSFRPPYAPGSISLGVRSVSMTGSPCSGRCPIEIQCVCRHHTCPDKKLSRTNFWSVAGSERDVHQNRAIAHQCERPSSASLAGSAARFGHFSDWTAPQRPWHAYRFGG